LPIWKLIVDVYSCHDNDITFHESELRISVIFKQHSELKEVIARIQYLLHLLFGYFILFPNSQFERIYCGDTNTQMPISTLYVTLY